MTFETDQRLKSYLDTNQLARERLCLAVLSLDKRYSHIKPRHPYGGRDGGADIDAVLNSDVKAVAAVGFVVGANDSEEQKKTITGKFFKDVSSALTAEDKPAALVFFTNINLTMGEKKELRDKAIKQGFIECEIYDRERIRIALDGVDGLVARFQYLAIPLSEAEQQSFFARWGDDIQSIVATGFQRIERTLNRLMFLQEAEEQLGSLVIIYELDRTYDPDELERTQIPDVVSDVFLIDEDLMHDAARPCPAEISFLPLRIQQGRDFRLATPVIDERSINPLHRSDLLRRTGNQNNAVCLEAFLFTPEQQGLGASALVDQTAANAEPGRTALAIS